MNPAFQNDIWRVSRERSGYYVWAEREKWQLLRRVRSHRHRCSLCEDAESREIVDSLLEHGLGLHPALDPLFEAFVRAEARLSHRFIPQRSHEERLTGNLVSEMDAALDLVRDSFKDVCRERYREERELDFIYYDLSRGGHLEKMTGADLGILLFIDLPDWPQVVRYAVLQAKKVHGSAQIPKRQFETILKRSENAAAYLFYDMDTPRGLPPMVLSADSLKSLAQEKATTDSFAVSRDTIRNGLPLSLWLFSELATERVGLGAPSFESAINHLTRELPNDDILSSGRLAILTVGRPLHLSLNQETGLDIRI